MTKRLSSFETRDLLCSICSRYFDDPRLLPCKHSFCLKCVKLTFKQQSSKTGDKKTFKCPLCGFLIIVPKSGIDGFSSDSKTRELRNKIIEDMASNISKDLKSSKENLEKDGHSFQEKKSNFTINPNYSQPMPNKNKFSSPYNNYSKYAKYFDSIGKDNVADYKPTLKPDHMRAGLETSTRFRNRQRSKEREEGEDKLWRRRTWYGSTLQSRRAQSLNRSFDIPTDPNDIKSSENLFKINEDRENTSSQSPTSPSPKTTTRPSRLQESSSAGKFPSEKSNLRSPSFQEPPISRRFLFSGPSRPGLSTHRENLVSQGRENFFSKQKHNDGFFREKKNKMEEEIKKREEEKKEKNNKNSKYVPFQKFNYEEKTNLKSEEPVPSERKNRQKKMEKEVQQEIKKEEKNEKEDETGGIGRKGFSEEKKKQEKIKKRNKKSLNKDDFLTEEEFKKHLLNITMSKQHYEFLMHDFRNGKVKQMEEEEEEEEEAAVQMEDENKENENNEKEKNPEELKHPRDPLIDLNLITNLRAKYSSSLDVKKFPKEENLCQMGEGIQKRWTFQKMESGLPSSATFLNNGCLVVADYGLSSLDFFDQKGRFDHCIGGMKPFGVTLNKQTGNVYVGDRRSKIIRVFDEFGADVSQIETLSSIEWLSGLGLRRDGGVVLCDRARCKIVICNSAGEKLKEFGSYGNQTKQLCMADFLAVDSKDRIVVADSGNHCIKIFDSSSGDLVKSFGERGGGEGQMEWPKGVAVDERDNILVADTLNRRISLFSDQGFFISHLVSMVLEPYNLSLSPFSSSSPSSPRNLVLLHHNLKGLSQYDVYSCLY